jgi:hypothetical protein
MKFSVLISVYKTEDPQFLEEALDSIWINQILKPNEIICVIDGPIPQNLLLTIDAFKNAVGNKCKIYQLDSNIGLGPALAFGLSKCSFELVARMDTDDISRENRFKSQISRFVANPKLDVLGSNAEEFSVDRSIIDSTRTVPLDHLSIIKKAKYRNPMNHPSVMYRKSRVLNAGGPQKFIGFDDYYLWIRMINDGSNFANIDESLVSLRAGSKLIDRRSGIGYIKNELRFQKYLLSTDFIGYSDFMRNLIVRVLPRLLPKQIQWKLYNTFLRN